MGVWRDTILPAVAPRVAHAYIRLLRASMGFEYDNREVLARVRRESGQYILAFWHSRFVMMPYAYPERRIVVFSSTHRDSQMLARVLERFGFALARGSSTVGGAAAMREVLRRVRDGYDVGITPDGPRGPRRRAKHGALAVARLSGLPLVPVAFSARPAHRLASWDRTLVPRPFARGLFVYGEPLRVPRDASEPEQERLRLALEAEIDRLTDLADERIGLGVEGDRPPVES